jgi:hypothetical protein
LNDRDQRRAAALAAFAKQVGWCESLGSPFTAQVLAALAADISAGGPAAELVNDWPGDPVADALALRMAASLHALALTEAAPDLAACYPPRAAASAEHLRTLLPAVISQHRTFIEGFIASPPQTNEVGRSGVLLGGFLEIADRSGLPLRLLEIGASAGLNTVWDCYHYQLADAEWGDAASAVRIAPAWRGPLPPLGAKLRVAERRACDIAPIDLEDAEQRFRLRAYVWADQRERPSRLENAIRVARAHGTPVERADAADWVEARLQAPAHGRATVLYHSIMWQYLPAPTQASIAASLDRAGRRATADAPLAWLRFEPTKPEAWPELRLTLWPDGQERCLATAQHHGSSIEWNGA